MTAGFYYAGAISTETWEAVKNENAKLPDEFSQTVLKNEAEASLNFKISGSKRTPGFHTRFRLSKQSSYHTDPRLLVSELHG